MFLYLLCFPVHYQIRIVALLCRFKFHDFGRGKSSDTLQILLYDILLRSLFCLVNPYELNLQRINIRLGGHIYCFGITPYSFEVVIVPGILLKYMYDDIRIVYYYPLAKGITFR